MIFFWFWIYCIYLQGFIHYRIQRIRIWKQPWSGTKPLFVEDLHDHIVKDPSILTGDPQLSSPDFTKNWKLFIGDPKFLLEPPDFNRRPQAIHRIPQIFIENPELFIEDPNLLGVTGVTIENQEVMYRLKIKTLQVFFYFQYLNRCNLMS